MLKPYYNYSGDYCFGMFEDKGHINNIGYQYECQRELYQKLSNLFIDYDLLSITEDKFNSVRNSIKQDNIITDYHQFRNYTIEIIDFHFLKDFTWLYTNPNSIYVLPEGLEPVGLYEKGDIEPVRYMDGKEYMIFFFNIYKEIVDKCNCKRNLFYRLLYKFKEWFREKVFGTKFWWNSDYRQAKKFKHLSLLFEDIIDYCFYQ